MNIIENIKLKNQSKVRKIKRIFATLLASMVALTTATMSGSVYANPSSLPTGNAAQVVSNGLLYYNSNDNTAYMYYALNTGTEDVYAFAVLSGSTYKLYYASLVENQHVYCQNGKGTFSTNNYTNTYDSTTGLYYNYSENTMSGTFVLIDKYDTLAEGLQAVVNGLIPPMYSSRKVEAGNVAILDFGSGIFNYDLTLTSYNYQKSGLFQGANAWNENGQAYYWSFTLPESGDSVSGTQITWEKAPNSLYPRDALGQTHYGISEMSGTGAARYLLIINPYINKISDSGQGDVNGWINIDGIPEGVGVYIYPMQQTITGLSNENVISPTEENPGGYGVATSQGGIVNTTTIGADSPYTQTTGGANSSMPLETIGDYVEDINNTLSGFSQNFLNLLKAPIEYIKALVEGAQNFFAYIAGLFTWLPQDINAFVVTGLMLVVIVGIFHSLL